MPRKFTIGRQNEQLLNKELHDMFMALKYLNTGYNTPVKDEQTDIPYGAVWMDPSFGKNVLKAYSQNRGWEPVFKNYYHPANILQKPDSPTHGQTWIDSSKNDLLHYYDENTGSWIAVSALAANKNDVGISGFDNFVNIFPLVPSITEGNKHSYLVPSELAGKMFDGGSYIHPSSEHYKKESEVSISFNDQNLTEQESWIHINPSRLNACEKKLVKVNKEVSSEKAYIIDINPYNTEFYGIDTTTKKGTLLRYKTDDATSDYTYTDVGIRLTSNAYKYDYVYAISYSFATSNYPGSLIRQSLTVGTEDEIYVGQYNKHPFVFLDGLYLEQEIYNYDHQEGVVRITNDDITQKMDMVSVIFKDFSKGNDGRGYEYTINQSNINGVDAVVGPLTANTQAFKKPMAFISGVMGVTANIYTPEEVTINETTATIKNIGPIANGDEFKVMIAESDGMYLDSGEITETKAIKSDTITGVDTYIVFVDGLLMSPNDLKLSEGEIKISGAVPGQQWILLKVADEEETAVIFDSVVSNYSIRINDNNEVIPYNNCDNAVVYVGEGVLVDLKAVERGELPKKGVAGQVIKYKKILEDGTAIEGYKIWDYVSYSWVDIEDDKLVTQISKLPTYFSTKGSISIIDNSFVGESLTYYAYTYNNSIDEPLLHDMRYTTVDTPKQFKVNFNHVFRPNVGALTTYLNNLLILPEEDTSGNGAFTMPEIDQEKNPYDEGEILYIVERPELNEYVACKRETLTAENRDPSLANTYITNLSLIPGVVNVFVNGVKLEREEYSLVNEHSIMIHFDIVGGQSHYQTNDKNTWKKYTIYTSEGIKTMDCIQPDEIIVEVREDYRLKTQTLPVRYAGQQYFSVDDDGLAETLLSTKDYVKIYINGIIYTGEYTINRDAGVIVLEDANITNNLNIDAMDRYFTQNPEAYAKYQQEYGKYYPKKVVDRITFEWR